jgi:two-component system sensor kinase FixL
MAKKATAQVERAADVIKRLRALVRLGRSELSPIGIDVVVHESLDLVRPLLERSAIAVSVDVDRELLPVMADRIQIEQVLFNLLRNSAEAIASAAGGDDGQIVVQARRSSAQLAEIRVSDSGPGFPDDIVGAIPTLFSSNKADGLGVGLSLCRSIVEAHGGALRLEPRKSGASVSFTLPFAEVATHDG